MTTPAADHLHFWTTCIQSLRLWVMQLVAWLAAVSGCREMRLMAREDLRQVRSELRFLLVTRVALDIEAGAFTSPTFRNSNNRAIDHRLSRRRFMRHALRGVFIRSLAEAKHMLDHIEIHVARVARNLRHAVKERGCFWSVTDCAAVGAIPHERIVAPDTS